MARLPSPGDHPPLIRIGELSRRVGVTVDRIRAWEQRYGLLAPARSAGGFRLYSEADERRIRWMLEHLDQGSSAAEAARAVLDRPAGGPRSPAALKQRLSAAFARFDEPASHELLSALFEAGDPEAALRDVVYPLLRELGDAWACGQIDVAQEHFASNLIQHRLAMLTPTSDDGAAGAHALLACPSGEQHVLGLIGLAVALRRRGWRVTYLGADTPVVTIARTARIIGPAMVVLAATLPHCLAALHTNQLRKLAGEHRLLLAGPGASAKAARRIGAHYIDCDPVGGAAVIAGMLDA